MAEDVHVHTGELSQAGAAAGGVAAEIAALDVSSFLTAVGEAMPGSNAARTAPGVADELTGALKNWSDAVHSFGGALEASARHYEGSDESTSSRLGHFAHDGRRQTW